MGFVVFLSFSIHAETPLLERTITLTLNQERVDIALTKISEQGDFTFSYSPNNLDVSRIITQTFAGNTVREVLEQIFQGNVHYKVRGNYIILTKAATTSTSQVLSGYVIDEATGKRIKNASVYDPISLSSAVTDDYGYFQIKIDQPSAEDVNLAITKLNYMDTVISVSRSRNGLLRIPISINQDKIASLADSVGEKIRRFWKTKVLAPQSVNIENIRDTLYRSTQVSLLPFIGTNHTLSGNVINDYSLNIFGGYSLGVERLEIGGIFNINRGDVKGAQFAGIVNAVGGRTTGLQMAGITNLNLDSVKGAQFAGLINLNWNSSQNFSAAGLINLTHRDSRGAHFAGMGNVTLGNQRGPHFAGLFNFALARASPVQVAGIWNFATDGIHGVQVAGLTNFAGKEAHGVQISGLINVAPGKLSGAQISGLINYATRVRGVQLGLINVADSIRGVPIGLFSFVRKGYHQLEISADEIFYANAAFRTGVRQFYNIFTVGAKPSSFKGDETYWTFGYGVGTAPRLSRRLSLNVDLTANQVGIGKNLDALNLLNKLYAGIEFRPVKNIGIIVGATLNAYVTDNLYTAYPELFTDYQPDIIYEKTFNGDLNVKMWWGGKVGVRFL